MKTVKKIGLSIISILALLFFLGIWYNYKYAMETAVPFEINTENQNKKLLIATQGSDFKEKVTLNVTNHYKDDSIFIKVVDVEALKDIQSNNYDAIVILHTWEYNKPPQVVQDFMARTQSFKDNIIALTTSGDGSHKLERVDAIAGESILTDISAYSDKIILKVDAILAKN